MGILNAKDYFRLDDKSREAVLDGAVKDAYFVPATIKADVLFRNMRKLCNSMAVVLDEYGGVEGIVTISDLIEQLVGDLHEESSEAKHMPYIEKINETAWNIVGNVELQEIEQVLNVDIGLEEVDTFTGLVFNELGIVPGDGEQDIELDFKGLHIHITRVEEHQIACAKVTKPVVDEEISE